MFSFSFSRTVSSIKEMEEVKTFSSRKWNNLIETESLKSRRVLVAEKFKSIFIYSILLNWKFLY